MPLPFSYEVEFSKPHPLKPIPEGTVKVYFALIEMTNGEFTVEFNFENESLRHQLDNTMRTNMFEKWIDRVLENKLKIKELAKEVRKSQKVNVESPRFISTLKRALEEMFTAADKDGSGALSYQEFSDAFKTLSYGLTDNDIKTLIALADDNADGKIAWEEFIPVAIDSIKTFFARNKALQKMQERDKEIRKEALELVYHDEIIKCGAIMKKKFLQLDEKRTGKITVTDFKEAMSSCALLTPKEVNVIVRGINPQLALFEYKNFEHILFEVRFELARSRLMDTGIDKLTAHLIEEF